MATTKILKCKRFPDGERMVEEIVTIPEVIICPCCGKAMIWNGYFKAYFCTEKRDCPTVSATEYLEQKSITTDAGTTL